MYNYNGGVNEGRTPVFPVYNSYRRAPLSKRLEKARFCLSARKWRRSREENGTETTRETFLGKMYALNFKTWSSLCSFDKPRGNISQLYSW